MNRDYEEYQEFDSISEKRDIISHHIANEGIENKNNPNRYSRVSKKKHKQLLKIMKENNKNNVGS